MRRNRIVLGTSIVSRNSDLNRDQSFLCFEGGKKLSDDYRDIFGKEGKEIIQLLN